VTTLSLYDPRKTGLYIEGWVTSVFLHGAIVTLAIVLFSDLTLEPQPEPFKWDVAMVQEVKPTRVETPAKPTPPVQETQETPPQEQVRPVETQPVVQAVQPTHRIVRQEVREVRQFAPATVTRVSRPRETVPVTHDTVAIPKEQPIVRQTDVQPAPQAEAGPPPASEPTPVSKPVIESGAETPVVREPVARQETVVAKATPAQHIAEAAPPPASEPTPVSRPVIESGAETPVVREPVARQETLVAKAAPAQQEAPVVKNLPVQARAAAKPDYSWLAEALWSRVERLKRYPHMARLNRWEGKVVLQAVVREDGQLLELKVAQTSGYAVLDQDALDVLRRASPLSLKHSLGQPQVVIQVPISYRLER
jgi:protein TonB